MQHQIILVNSITYAIKGRDLLRKHGFKSHIERKTATKGNFGCGYVIVAYGNKQKIITLLKDYGIKILEISSIA